MASLLESLKGMVTPELIAKAAGFLGESESSTGKAMGAILPTVLGGLVDKGSSTTGASDILDMVKSGNFQQGGNVLGSLSGLFGGDSPQSTDLMSTGTSLISSLFGDKIGGIASLISSFSGVKQSSTNGLLSMAAPLVMSMLGKKIGSDGLNASSLMNLFSSEKAEIASALPAGLGGLLGLGGMSGSIPEVSAKMADIVSPPLAYVPPTPAYSAPVADGIGKWLWPLILLGLAAGLIWYFMRGCQTPVATTAAMADSAAVMVDNAGAAVGDAAATAEAAVDSAAGAVSGAAARVFGTLKLADGVELNVPNDGVEASLIRFIEDKSKPVDKKTWFTFDRLYFDTGKSTLKAESKEQLENIAKIMKAYPNVNLKMGGYTDNTGSVEGNMKLSTDRAQVTMKQLAEMGIGAARLSAEGYGPQFPVATNDTEEGRSKNRRIDVRVTKK
jgi:OmpA-OmpF porin, OOP family